MYLFIKYNLIILQLAVPFRKGAQRVESLGVTDHIQRSRILSRPGKDQRRERCYPDGPQRQPVARSWNSGSFHWLHCIQCQHQPLLRSKVLDLSQHHTSIHLHALLLFCMSKIIYLLWLINKINNNNNKLSTSVI